MPDDFLVLTAKAMDYLKCNNRSNVLYKLAKGIGTMREDETDSRFPTKRMPMCLVEYAANFYAADNLQSVRILFFMIMHVFNIEYLYRYRAPRTIVCGYK